MVTVTVAFISRKNKKKISRAPLFLSVKLLCSHNCLCVVVAEIHGDFVDSPPKSLRSLAEEDTFLPCQYQPTDDNKVVQVTWYRQLSDATKDQIITVHHKNGQTGAHSNKQIFFWYHILVDKCCLEDLYSPLDEL